MPRPVSFIGCDENPIKRSLHFFGGKNMSEIQVGNFIMFRLLLTASLDFMIRINSKLQVNAPNYFELLNIMFLWKHLYSMLQHLNRFVISAFFIV